LTAQGGKSDGHLDRVFAADPAARKRYLYFADKADIQGEPDIAALFRSMAEGEAHRLFGISANLNVMTRASQWLRNDCD